MAEINLICCALSAAMHSARLNAVVIRLYCYCIGLCLRAARMLQFYRNFKITEVSYEYLQASGAV